MLLLTEANILSIINIYFLKSLKYLECLISTTKKDCMTPGNDMKLCFGILLLCSIPV